MKQYIYILIGFALIFTSCSDFLDVNDDPTRISEEQASLRVLLPSLCEATSSAYASASNQAMNVTHHLTNVQSGYYQEFSMSGAWSEIYLKCIPLSQVISEKADEQNSPHYKGIAQVLEAVNLALLTDAWENAAYTEANQLGDNTKPKFDSQEDIYDDILELLDSAIENLSSPESDYEPGNDDFFYGGDTEKWIKAAHSLKARNLLHLVKRGKADAASILAEVSEGMQGPDDNLEHYYTDINANPFFSSISKKFNESIYTKVFGKFYIDYLNGNTYDVVDPRLPYIASIESEDSTYFGYEDWLEDDNYSSLPLDTNYLMMAESPVIIMSYAELMFIAAEVSLTSGIGDGEQAYKDGIQASFADIGVSGSALSDYLNHPNVDVYDLEHIMKEKYIALMYNFEAWNDMRRHEFSPEVYKGYVEPVANGRSLPAYRALYPSFELARNQANIEANTKDFTEKMWKDQ